MVLLTNSQDLQKGENDIVIFNGNVLGHEWHNVYDARSVGWEEDKLLFTCMPHANIQINWL